MNALILLVAVGGWGLAGILGIFYVVARSQRDEALRALRHAISAEQAWRETAQMTDEQIAADLGRMTKK